MDFIHNDGTSGREAPAQLPLIAPLGTGAFEFVRVKTLSVKTTGASSTDAVIQICAEHNLRQGHCHSRDKQSGTIDPARSHLNVTFRGCDTAAAVARMARDLVRVGSWQKQYQRSNAAVGAELVFSLPPNTQLDVIAYFRACVVWAEQFFDAPALSATVHLDQRQPHAHLIFLGVRGGQWRGGRFFGNRTAIKRMHAAFHAAVGEPHGLRRKQQSSESAAIRHATAAREFDAIMAHHGLMNDPGVRQALVALIAADPERLRAAREQAMAACELPIALPGDTAPDGGNPKRYPVIALPPNDDTLVEPAYHYDQQAAPPAATMPQLVTPAPIPIVLDDRTGPPADGDGDGDGDGNGDGDGDGDGDDDGNFVRERDDQVAAAYWNSDLGQFILPPATPTSRQARARKLVQEALTNLALEQSIRSP